MKRKNKQLVNGALCKVLLIFSFTSRRLTMISLLCGAPGKLNWYIYSTIYLYTVVFSYSQILEKVRSVYTLNII